MKLFLGLIDEKIIMIENKVILILWQRGNWKTMFASLLSLEYNYKIIYSNYTLHTPGKKNIMYEYIDDILSLRYSKDKKLIIFDEWWVNLNSRQSMMEANIKIWQMIFLSRKINADFIFITQFKFTIDKYIRYSSDYQIIMNRTGETFQADIYKTAEQSENWIYIKTIQYTLQDYINSGVVYDTLEKSILLKW